MVTQSSVNKIVIRKNLTQEKFDELISRGEIGPNDISLVNDGSVAGGITKVQNTVVKPEYFVVDTKYEGYYYRADIPVTGITGSDYPNVLFGYEDSINGNFSFIAESKDGYVSIWAIRAPEVEFVIPLITYQ